MSEVVEKWIDIIGYEGMYKISNLCRVKSMKFGKERIMKQSITKGYYQVGLTKDGKIKIFRVHQLVAQAFLGHVIDGMNLVVNHIDGNKENNNVDNLEIVTQRENSSGKCFRKKQLEYTSQYDNVCWNKSKNKWQSYIQYNNILYHLGLFIIEENARDSSVLALSYINTGTFIDYYINLKNKLKNNNYKKILQYTKNGEFIREWNSATEAGKELRIYQESICMCCRGRRKTAGGFIWKYKED